MTYTARIRFPAIVTHSYDTKSLAKIVNIPPHGLQVADGLTDQKADWGTGFSDRSGWRVHRPWHRPQHEISAPRRDAGAKFPVRNSFLLSSHSQKLTEHLLIHLLCRRWRSPRFVLHKLRVEICSILMGRPSSRAKSNWVKSYQQRQT